jgi:hypothetical protein
MRYVYAVRLSSDDVGKRVVIRWRRPASGAGEEIADVLGILEAADPGMFAVRDRAGRLVTVPRERMLAGKTVPAPPRRDQPTDDPGRIAGSAP